PQVAEQLDAAQAGHRDVREHHVVGLLAQEGEGLLRGVRGVAQVLFAEQVVEHVADCVVVVNDKDGGHRFSPSVEVSARELTHDAPTLYGLQSRRKLVLRFSAREGAGRTDTNTTRWRLIPIT